MELSPLDINIKWESNADEAIAKIKEGLVPDLALIDLVHNGVNRGAELAKICESNSIPYIVMTSHNTQYVYREMTTFNPEAFYSKPLDYLSLKYFINRFLLQGNDKELENNLGGIYVKKKSSLIKILYHDILWIHGEGNYVTIVTYQEKFVHRISLKRLIIEMPSDQFIRIHRNYIVRLDQITKIDMNKDRIIIDKFTIPIGRSFKKDLRSKISKQH